MAVLAGPDFALFRALLLRCLTVDRGRHQPFHVWVLAVRFETPWEQDLLNIPPHAKIVVVRVGLVVFNHPLVHLAQGRTPRSSQDQH